jgi:hypothetical protein
MKLVMSSEDMNHTGKSMMGRRSPYGGAPVRPQGTPAGSLDASVLAAGYQVTSKVGNVRLSVT